jgi:hypothetical protein
MKCDTTFLLGTTPSRILSDNELYLLVTAYLVFAIAVALFCVYQVHSLLCL